MVFHLRLPSNLHVRNDAQMCECVWKSRAIKRPSQRLKVPERDGAQKKIKGKLYIIKGYREPLKKLHMRFFSQQQKKIHNNKNVAAVKLCNTPSDRIEPNHAIRFICSSEKHAKWIHRFSIVILIFLCSFLRSSALLAFQFLFSYCINNVASVRRFYILL